LTNRSLISAVLSPVFEHLLKARYDTTHPAHVHNG